WSVSPWEGDPIARVRREARTPAPASTGPGHGPTRRSRTGGVVMGEFRKAFDVTVAANRELHKQIDAALVEAGRKIADRVDEATSSGEGQEVTKALYLVPHMMNVL